jgi:phosphatidylethanolamine/phosphatidyl-N-methylethanolamine N-methyltransferase
MKRLVKVLLQNPGAASLVLFTREIWANPRAMGAACPSTPSLASRMAARVPLDQEGLVVELGGGTGAVTTASAQARRAAVEAGGRGTLADLG